MTTILHYSCTEESGAYSGQTKKALLDSLILQALLYVIKYFFHSTVGNAN